MDWSGEHRGFVVETFFKNESVIATQRAFRRHFRLGRRAPVPDRKTILLWVSNMRATGLTLKRKTEFGVWGPYFFEKEGVTVTVTSDRYCDMLQNFLRPKMDELEEDVWFQQDGATAHTSRRSLSIFREMFPGHLISLRGDIGWPARSPDLTPVIFFSGVT